VNKLAIGLSLAAALAVQSANAGLHSSYGITVSGTVAYGQVRGARNSTDNKQFIGCAAYGAVNTYSTYVACSASDANGHVLYCSTYNPNYYVWQAAMSVTSMSSIIFNADSSGHCIYVYVSNNSTNL
jgi:hypothetical protein